MDAARIKEIWAGLGKLVKLAEVGAADASGVRAHMVGTLQQFGRQAGGADYYDDMMQVVIPLETRVQPSIAAIDRIGTLAKASAEAYVRVLGSELGQASGASTATILAAFKASMVAASVTIYPSGKFWNYFASNFGYAEFPAALPPTVPEAWVTTSVVDPGAITFDEEIVP